MLRQRSRSGGRNIVAIIYLIGSLGATTVLTGYNDNLRNPSHASVGLSYHQTKLLVSHIQNLLPAWIQHPTPQIFFFACIMYFISSTLFYQYLRDDHYQDRFLFGGFAAAAILGLVRGQEIRTVVLVDGPWCTSGALLLSAALHGVLGWTRVRVPLEDACDLEKAGNSLRSST